MLLTNANIATMAKDQSYGLVENGAVVLEGEHIVWVGPQERLPDGYKTQSVTDVEGRLITPGLIDCHTHIVFGGNRAEEFEMRLNGASYEEISRSGGGIVSTVSSTREATEDQLLEDALTRVDALIAEGVTTLEIKSGYGLDLETESKMLRVARRICSQRSIDIKTSFLGAHAIPPEFAGEPDRYIDDVCIRALKAAHGEKLVDAVDGFCEGIAFNAEQIERVFNEAKALGLPVKLHAEQLSNIGGAQLAAKHGALSADHLEYLNEDDVRKMSASGTVAVLLPGAFYTLRETQLPPVQLLRDRNVPMAIATDCNPGSSPLASILLTMNMGSTLFGLTPQETLAGVTKNAATALGLKDRGSIKPGNRADLCIWNAEHPAELSYRIGFNPIHTRIFGGNLS